MKKYVIPEMRDCTFDLREMIAIEGNPYITTSDQLAKDRNDNLDDEQALTGDPEWKEGLW